MNVIVPSTTATSGVILLAMMSMPKCWRAPPSRGSEKSFLKLYSPSMGNRIERVSAWANVKGKSANRSTARRGLICIPV